METLKKKLCWVNSEFEGSCHCFRTVKYIKRRIMCKRHGSRGGQQEGDTDCMLKARRERDKTWNETLKEGAALGNQ